MGNSNSHNIMRQWKENIEIAKEKLPFGHHPVPVYYFEIPSSRSLPVTPSIQDSLKKIRYFFIRYHSDFRDDEARKLLEMEVEILRRLIRIRKNVIEKSRENVTVELWFPTPIPASPVVAT